MVNDEDKYNIRASMLVGFVEAVGGDWALAHDLLEAVGIPPAMLNSFDEMIPFRRVMALFIRAAHERNDPSFGLRWSSGMPFDYQNPGPLLLLGFACKTMGEWVQQGIKYWQLHTNTYTLSLELPTSGPNGMLRLNTPNQPFPPRQWVEYSLANVCRMGRHVSGSDAVTPVAVRFQHARPEDVSLHDQIFRCPLEFGAEHNELVYDPAMLAHPTQGGMKKLHEMLASHVRTRLDRLEIYDHSVGVLLSQIILSLAGTGLVSAPIAAESLGMSVKTMHRKLAEEGTSFSKVLEKCRLEIAERLLAGSQISVGVLAGLLDYAGHAQFTAAFKRWKGVSPRAFRQNLVASPN